MRKRRFGIKSFDSPAKGMFLQQQHSRSFSCLFSFPGGLSARICRCKRFTSVPKIFQNCLNIVMFFTNSERCLRTSKLSKQTHFPRLQKHRHYNVCAGFKPKLSQTHAPFKHTLAPSHCTTWNVQNAASSDIKGSHQQHAQHSCVLSDHGPV